jgi:PAS domain S-box-containing protein
MDMSRSADVRLPPLLDDLDVGIVIHDPETGAILDVNGQIEELYGYSSDVLRTMSVGDVTAPSTKFTDAEASARIRDAANGEPQTFEWQIERANEELRWIRVHLDLTTVDGSQCVLAEVEDITDYRARERRLRLLSRIVRHNLRNQANLLKGYVSRIERAVEDESLEKEIETILRVTSEVGALSESVRQLEEIAEPNSTTRSPTNLGTVVQRVVEEARNEYPGVDLRVETAERVWVTADRGLRYAIEHALENAIEHNDRETPAVTVTVSDDVENERGVVRVADDGPRIPDAEIDVLNEDVETSSTYHGSGVGLWVMQWCISSLGGELGFEENTPRGNVVTMSLPRIHERTDA